VEKIPEEKLLGYNYDHIFEEKVGEKYPTLLNLAHFGDLRLGMILKSIEGEGALYDLWLEQFSKKYSPLTLPEFEDAIDKKYGNIIREFVSKIKY
jgi:hypothetical protein